MTAVDDLRPLDAAIDEIRLLHRAAERAASRIGAESQHFRAGAAGTRGPVAEVADALVERTEAIREDCRRLERLLERARAAVASDLGAAPAAPQAPVAPAEPAPAPYFEAPGAAAEPPLEPSAPWRLWRRRQRGRPASPAPTVPPPARLPRPDFLAPGVTPALERREHVAPGHPPVPEGVRLIATQMAVAGASRVEVERRLQRQFGIAGAEDVLDEIYGYASPAPASDAVRGLPATRRW